MSVNREFELLIRMGVDISGIQKNLKNVKKAIEKATGQMADSFDDVSSEATKEFNKVEKEAGKTANKVEKEFNEAGNKGKQAFTGMSKSLGKEAKKMEGTAKTASGKISGAFKGLGGSTKGSFSTIASAFKSSTSKIGGIASGVSKEIVSKFKSVGSATKGAFSKIGSAFKAGTSKIKGIASKVANSIKAEFKSGCDGAENAVESMSAGMKTALGAIAGYVSISGINGIVDQAQELSVQSAKLKTAFETSGSSAKDAEKTYGELYKTLGDSDRAVEASGHIAKMTKDQKAMQEWTNICAGVWGTFGDSLPIEGLTEAANETAKVGSVTGVLADALNWAGISEDSFNAKLEACNSEAEREKLIRETLTKTYDEASKTYKEANKDVMALREAELKQQSAMETLGKKLMPLKTMFLEFGSAVLDTVANIDFSGVQSAFEKFFDVIKVAFEWVINNKDLVISAVTGIASAFLAFKVIKTVQSLISGFGTIISFVTSPIGIAVIAIGVLVGSFVLLYKKSETFRNAVQTLKDKLITAWNAIKESAVSLKDKVGEAFDNLKERFQPLIDALTINLQGAFYDVRNAVNEFKGKLDELKSKFQPVADVISGAFSEGLDSAKDKLGELKDKAVDLAEKGLTKLNDIVSDLREGFMEFRTFVNQLLDNLEPLAKIISDNMVNAFKSLSDPVSEIKDSFDVLWDTLKELGKYLWDEIKPIFEALKPLLKIVGALFGAGLVTQIGFAIGIFNGLVKAIKGVVKIISGVIKTVVNIFKLIVGMFTGNADMISGAWEGIKDGVIDVIIGAWEAVKGFLSGFWQGLSGFFKGLFNTDLGKKLKEKVVEIWNSIKEAWNEQWDKMKEQWNTLKTFISDLWEGVKTKTSEVWKLIKENTIGKVIEMKEKAVEKFNDMKDKLIEKVSTIKSKIKEKFEDMKELAKDLMDGMKKKINSGAKGFANAFIKAINKAISGFLKGLNKLISGVNWIWEKITGTEDKFSKIKVENHKIPLLAKGTSNWQGGLAIFGEKGKEIVSDPNMGTFVANSASLGYLSKGATVIPNKQTEQILGSLGVPSFGRGLANPRKQSMTADSLTHQTGKGKEIVEDVWEYVSDPLGLLKYMWDKFVGFDELPKWMTGLTDGVKKIFTSNPIVEWVKKLFDESTPTNVSGSGEAWTKHILKAASFFGETLTDNELKRIIHQINVESGGNAGITQSMAVRDINALTGNLARGLLQYVPSTFNAYKVKGFGDIWNGYHQLLAFFNNSTWRKALPQLNEKRGWSPRGKRRMAEGGLVKGGRGGILAEIGEASHDELVVPLNQKGVKPIASSVIDNLKEEGFLGGTSDNVEYTINVPVQIDGKQVAVATAKFTREELDKMDRRSNRLHGRK